MTNTKVENKKPEILEAEILGVGSVVKLPRNKRYNDNLLNEVVKMDASCIYTDNEQKIGIEREGLTENGYILITDKTEKENFLNMKKEILTESEKALNLLKANFPKWDFSVGVNVSKISKYDFSLTFNPITNKELFDKCETETTRLTKDISSAIKGLSPEQMRLFIEMAKKANIK